MAAVMNGLSLTKLRPFGATFFIFSDYARPAIRLSALMELPTIFVFTHDAMGDGEDGPDAPAGRAARVAARDSRPHAAAPRRRERSRRGLPRASCSCGTGRRSSCCRGSRCPRSTARKYAPAAGVAHGAYVLADAPGGKPEVILIATGSEVSLAVEAHEMLLAAGIRSRVVSMPSWDIFEHQTQEYRDSVLPPAVTARVAIEQASTFGWERYVGTRAA